MKKFVKHGIAIIGIAVLVFLAVGSAASGPSTSGVSSNDVKEATIHYNKGKEYYEKRDYDQAITELTESIRLNPNYDNAYFYRGYAYLQKSDFDQAIADFDKAIQIDPKHWGFYSARGGAYGEKGDYDRAIADYDKAIQLDSKRASVYNSRAWTYVYYLKRDFDRAISDANQAVNLDPNEADYLDTRGWAYLGNGDYEKAIADFEKALQINSDLKSSKEGLAQARLARIKPEPVKDEDFVVKQNADNTLTITEYKGTSKNVIIPDTLYGLKVTIIGNDESMHGAFHNKGLISVVIPDTVVTIENRYYDGVFSSNRELIKVTLGKGIKTIGNSAFEGCSQLTEIIIPDSVTRIGASSFSETGLIKVILGKGLQTIGDGAFYRNQITEINLPSSLKEIGRQAFSDNKIQKLTLGTGLQTIEGAAFKNNQITEINFDLPTSLKIIQPSTFAGNKIQSVNIPNGITSMPAPSLGWTGAFSDNPLTTVVIPASLTGDARGFGINRDTITRITIPAGMNENTLKSIFESSFVNFWINQNRAGGTYVKRGPIWAKE